MVSTLDEKLGWLFVLVVASEMRKGDVQKYEMERKLGQLFALGLVPRQV
jgi:hypothetical protein